MCYCESVGASDQPKGTLRVWSVCYLPTLLELMESSLRELEAKTKAAESFLWLQPLYVPARSATAQ